jgi:hypothetical protein
MKVHKNQWLLNSRSLLMSLVEPHGKARDFREKLSLYFPVKRAVFMRLTPLSRNLLPAKAHRLLFTQLLRQVYIIFTVPL